MVSASDNMTVEPIVVSAFVTHTATLIFLHGLNDTADPWSFEMKPIRNQYVKIILPTANAIPLTLYGGAKATAWFDLEKFGVPAAEDEVGIKSATTYVHNLIEEELNKTGIMSERIVLGGFDQGGALALYAGLTFPKRLAGILAIACWLPLSGKLSPSMVTANKDVPILMTHGQYDQVIPYDFGKSNAELLTNFSCNVNFKSYIGLNHFVSNEQKHDIKEYLEQYLPPAF